jgi:hypothetical protein
VTDPGRLRRSVSELGETLQWLEAAGLRLSIEPEIDTGRTLAARRRARGSRLAE